MVSKYDLSSSGVCTCVSAYANVPFPLPKPNHPDLNPIRCGQHHGLLTVSDRDILPQRRIDNIGQQPGKLALCA